MLYVRTSKDIEDIDVSLIKLGDSKMSDPWKHRSSGMKCGSCMWYAVKQVYRDPLAPTPDNETVEPVQEGRLLGRCRRHAPTMSGYPAVFDGDWCGDHKLDENKA